jgi:hypothetical protein
LSSSFEGFDIWLLDHWMKTFMGESFEGGDELFLGRSGSF